MPTPFPAITPLYCTDEALAVRAPGDYVDLCPPWQTLAAGSDGVFLAGAPWVLTSAAQDFQALGVLPNGVIALTGPRPQFTGSGQLFAVEAVAPNAVTLRRVGQAAGAGAAPAPAAGLTGVSFVVRTFAPQIDSASYDLRQRFDLDPLIPYMGPAELYDPRVLEQPCLLMVLVRLYAASNRSRDGDWAQKLDLYRQELDDVLDRTQIRFGRLGAMNLTAGRMAARLSR